MLETQRRQLTVLFCDLVGSTELSNRVDAEDLRDLLNDFLAACREQVEKAGGYVARYMGDGLLAYFGYPTATGQDARSAIQAALGIRKAVSRIVGLDGDALKVRIGIATGLVVVGDPLHAGGAEERVVVGATPNLAARLQAAAQPNSILVSGTTRSLAAQNFTFRSTRTGVLKGFSRAERQAWEVAGELEAADRFGAHQSRGLSPFCGRDEEMAAAMACWVHATSGHLRVLGVAGDPGMGKSRLVHELRSRVGDDALWLQGGGAEVFRHTPFHVVRQALLAAVGGASLEDRIGRLASLAGANRDSAIALLSDFLDVDVSDGISPLDSHSMETRAQLITGLADLLLRLAALRPLVLVLEDLHWADPSTQDFLAHLAARSPDAGLLIVYTTRDAIWAPAAEGPGHWVLRLGALDASATARVIQHVAGGRLRKPLVEELVARVQGVPFFAEEFARLMGGVHAAANAGEIPASLAGVLTARLDRLGSARPVAQVAAVLGAEFRLDLLAAMLDCEAAALSQDIAALETARVVYRVRDEQEPPTYRFSHGLMQEAAYQGLLRRDRRLLHRRAASLISSHDPELARSHPERLAQHWAAAGEQNLEVEAWHDAGRLRMGSGSFREAQQAYEQALTALMALPPSPERDERELALQSALSGVLQITLGYSSLEARAASARAHRLMAQGGDIQKQIAQVTGAWMAASSAGEYRTAARLAERLLPLAQADGGPVASCTAQMALMTSHYRTGNLTVAELAYQAGRAGFSTGEFAKRPGAMAQTFGNAAIVAWLRGDREEARSRIAMALRGSRSGGSYQRAFALYMAGMLAAMMSDPARAGRLARKAIALCDANGFPQFAATSRIVFGYARSQLGAPKEGRRLIDEGLRRMEATGSHVGRTMYLTWRARACVLLRDLTAADETLDLALGVNPEEMFYRPETLIERAELRASTGETLLARDDLLTAARLARRMKAPLSHARAAAALRALINAG